MSNPSIHEALGSPAAAERVPGPKHPAWVKARWNLAKAINKADTRARKYIFRTWQSLWLALHDTEPPRDATWALLAAQLRLSDILPKLTSTTISCPVVSWNVRWLVAPNTPVAAAKRAVILRALGTGKAVCLQETHWKNDDQALWEILFPTYDVHSSPAILGPSGGPVGGVAIILPHNMTLRSVHVRVPGCGLEVIVERDNARLSISSIYLPPDRKENTINALLRNDPEWEDIPRYLCGDFNIDILHPRNQAEAELVPKVQELLHVTKSAIVDCTTATRRTDTSKARIDYIAAPCAHAWRLTARTQWHANLSDHGVLGAHDKPSCSVARPCKPHTLKNLPKEAFTDLRKRFRQLEIRFQLPPPRNISVVDRPAFAPDRRVSSDDPTRSIWDEADPNRRITPPSNDTSEDQQVEFNMQLAIHGQLALTNLCHNWWKHWCKKIAAKLLTTKSSFVKSLKVAGLGPFHNG